MLDSIRRTMRNLRSHTCGNATLLLALGMPALVGGAGLAVDTAQWYMWKRELQFAVDQAALAGAWARSDSATETTYRTRALQELNTNLAMTSGTTTTPTVSLANYAGGSNNSVTVRVTASRSLPFSSFLTGRAASVAAFAQATFDEGESFTSCMIALDDDDSGAFVIGGSASLIAGCGIAALSNSPSSIIINGNPTVDPGWVLSRGGIDDWLDTNTDADIHEYMTNLVDPFAALSPPNNTTPRTYGCVTGSTTTRANVSTTVVTSYNYWRGSNSNSATAYTYSPARASTTTSSGPSNQSTVTNGTTNGSTSASSSSFTQIGGSGSNKIYEKQTVTTTTTYAGVTVATTPTQASLLPGTYGSIDTSCTTVLSSGVYVINGGTLKINAQHNFTASGVMFVLKGGADISINGGANVSMTAMTQSQLETAGVSTTQAAALAGMLIFEDRSSTARRNANKINGNATTILNGTIYLPNSDVTFSGSAGVTSQCLMIAAARITIQGNANMSTFCPPGAIEDSSVASSAPSVKLVA